MEFEKNTAVSDEERRLAEAKKLTLQPVHGDVIAEENPDETASRHMAGPPIANVPSDVEQSTGAVQSSQGTLITPAPATQRPQSNIIIIVVIGVVALITLVVLLLTK